MIISVFGDIFHTIPMHIIILSGAYSSLYTFYIKNLEM